ncbi:hydantoin racemase, partial [Candidatus Bipolaricaulota bacterium]|nr:hydantoin racemase [Candidatus Bipolaricaulota bacterium]
EAIENDRAEVIILGCTGAHGFYKRLQQGLGVPVIDPGIAAVKYAEFLVEIKNRFGWKHSKVGAYETPPREEILRWQLGAAELWQ